MISVYIISFFCQHQTIYLLRRLGKKSFFTISNLFSEFRIVFDDQLSTCSELLGYSEVNTDYSKEHISQGLINLEPIHMLNVSFIT